jgi:hypothetical protein
MGPVTPVTIILGFCVFLLALAGPVKSVMSRMAIIGLYRQTLYYLLENAYI